MSEVMLRDVRDDDLPIFFEHQRDPDAVRVASFQPRALPAFEDHWRRSRGDASVRTRTIVVDGSVAGYVATFAREGRRLVAYWLGKAYWGRGVATRALARLLTEETVRPLHAFVAKDNVASRRVLEKCGFVVVPGGAPGPAADGVEEHLLELR